MKDFTEKELDRMFSKAMLIDGCDQNEWRIDASGRLSGGALMAARTDCMAGRWITLCRRAC